MNVWRRSLVVWLLCALTTAASALERIELSLGDLQGGSWRAQALRLAVDLAGLAGEITLDELVLPDPLGTLGAVRVQCNELLQDEHGLHCRGLAEVAQLLGQPARGAVLIEHEPTSGCVHIRWQDVRFAEGQWRIDATLQDQRWQIAVQAVQIDSAAAQALVQRFVTIPDYTVAGRVSLQVQLQTDADGVRDLRFRFASEGLNFANAAGSQAGEELQLELAGEGRRQGADWRGDLRVVLDAGALFLDPLYLEPTPTTALRLTSGLRWSAQQQRVFLHALTLEHAQVAQVQADAQVRLGDSPALERLEVEVREAQLPGAYTTYIQPWLRGRLGDALTTAGRFSGQYTYRAGADTRLQLELHGVDVEDEAHRFGFDLLNGSIVWGSDPTARTTTLRWASGSLYRLALGAADFAIVSRGTEFELPRPIRIPILDGELQIRAFALSDPGQPTLRWHFDGQLTPISMEALCTALEWPRFSGQLAGNIPAVRYADGVLEVGGELHVQAFDGDLRVHGLRLEQPFGIVPRLNADLSVAHLDLDALTRTFAFGKIEGRLSGYINRLQMEAWQPVAFDAAFATPEDDDSRHRISQKAVDNITSIGGGMGGALSRGFLGMFEDFPYERLGIRCVLENGVCHMGGVAPAEQGYYLVKGRFLPPRIDVVGYADRVDWQTLIERLRSVTLDQAPVVR